MSENRFDYQALANEIGALVNEKNKAYGNSFEQAEEFLKLLFPNGIPIESYSDMLCIVRISVSYTHLTLPTNREV